MKNKQEILTELRKAMTQGVITKDDLRPFFSKQPGTMTPATSHSAAEKLNKLSAVDVMFYVSGIVLFSAIMSLIVQSWNDGNPLVHILLSAGVGIGLWTIAYYMIKNPSQNDIQRGLINALLLTGSLSIVVGGYIISNELIGGFTEVNFTASAITLAILGGLHIGFDRLIKRDLTLLSGILLVVASFPALLFGFLKDANAPSDVWYLVPILASGILAYATRVVAKINPNRPKLHNAFDSLTAFIALMSMYVASYGEFGALWLIILTGGVLILFYLSILSQNKHLLGNASFFLVLAVITISFKYFSGYGTTASLIVATLGLLGSATAASSINKRYFKKE